MLEKEEQRKRAMRRWGRTWKKVWHLKMLRIETSWGVAADWLTMMIWDDNEA